MNSKFRKLFESLPYDLGDKEHISIRGLLMHISEEIVRFVIFPVVIEMKRSDIISIEEAEQSEEDVKFNFPIVNLVIKKGASLSDIYVCPLPELISSKTSIFSFHASSEFPDFFGKNKDFLQLEKEYLNKFGL